MDSFFGGFFFVGKGVCLFLFLFFLFLMSASGMSELGKGLGDGWV